MNALWYKEWREFTGNRRTLLLRLVLPLLLLGPLMRMEALRMPALAGALVWLGAYNIAAQVSRERISGYLPRLALTPAPAGLLILHRVLCRSLLLTLQMAPVLLAAAWLGAPPSQLLHCLPAIPAACAAGAVIGLRAPSRRGAQLAGLLVAAASALAGWGLGAPTIPADSPGGITLMGVPGLGLPLHLALWALMGGLMLAAHQCAPGILGHPDESMN